MFSEESRNYLCGRGQRRFTHDLMHFPIQAASQCSLVFGSPCSRVLLYFQALSVCFPDQPKERSLLWHLWSFPALLFCVITSGFTNPGPPLSPGIPAPRHGPWQQSQPGSTRS